MMNMNYAVSYVLMAGVIASLLLLTTGIILLFLNGGSNGFSISSISRTDTHINSSQFPVSAVLSGLSTYQGLDFILLGLMVLIATPVVRVLLSVLIFLYNRNWLYVAITLIVFIDLMVAVFVVPGLLVH